MKRFAMLFSVLAMAGCGYSEDSFTDDYMTNMCDKLVECEAQFVEYYTAMGLDEATSQSTFDTTYTAVCESTTDVEDTGAEVECTFDADLAKTCVDDLAAAVCDAAQPIGFATPTSCNTVYTCP